MSFVIKSNTGDVMVDGIHSNYGLYSNGRESFVATGAYATGKWVVHKKYGFSVNPMIVIKPQTGWVQLGRINNYGYYPPGGGPSNPNSFLLLGEAEHTTIVDWEIYVPYIGLNVEKDTYGLNFKTEEGKDIFLTNNTKFEIVGVENIQLSSSTTDYKDLKFDENCGFILQPFGTQALKIVGLKRIDNNTIRVGWFTEYNGGGASTIIPQSTLLVVRRI